jgi:hypothetical protein
MSNKICQGKLVDRTHEKANVSRGLMKENVLVCSTVRGFKTMLMLIIFYSGFLSETKHGGGRP